MNLRQFYFISDSLSKFLSKAERDFLSSVSIEKKVQKSSAIFLEGTFPSGVYILKKGRVKLCQQTAKGTEQILNIHIADEIFGYRPLLCDEAYPVSAKTIEDSEVAFIPKKDFLNLLSRSNNLSNALLRFLSYEFTVWVNTISNLAHRNVRDRLLINLLILSEKYRTKNKWPVEISLSRADLAALIGTSNETLARNLSKLKREKLIAANGRIIIMNNAAQEDRIRKSISKH